MSGPHRLRLSPIAYVILGSALCWTLLFVLIWPSEQNFPLNDDWAYSRGAFAFARGEGFHYQHWAAMPLLGQWLWACPFIWLGHQSHAALRLATIILSWLGLWALYDLLKQEGVSPGRAALAVAALASHPLFFLLQGTFMTDVPAFSLALLALALYQRALMSGRVPLVAAAALVAALATATRQNTLAVPIVAAIALWHRPDLRWKPAWLAAVLLPFIIGLGVHWWMRHRSDVLKVDLAIQALDVELRFPFVALEYVGLAAVPLFVLTRPARPLICVASLAVVAAGAIWFWLHPEGLPFGGLYPYASNMLTPLGAFTDFVYLGGRQRPIVLTAPIRAVLTVLATLGGAGVLAALCRWLQEDRRGALLLWLAAWQVPFLVLMPQFDRYLIFLMPAGLFLLCRAPEVRAGWPAGLVLVVLSAGFSVALMHDWLAWNSVRWQLGSTAGVAPTRIEGGFEWDGWHSMAIDPMRPPVPPRGMTLSYTARCFADITGEYGLSFSELEGTVRRAALRYRQWLSPGRHYFYLLALPDREP
jgi:hypothetical protein